MSKVKRLNKKVNKTDLL